MKEYLKMADVFDLPLITVEGRALTEVDDLPVADFDHDYHATYAAHAINSHDELVAEVAALTEFCERFRIFCEDVGEFMGSGREAN